MKISTVVFGGGKSTLGMDVVTKAILDGHLSDKVEVTPFSEKNVQAVKDADVLMFSLCWLHDALYFMKFLKDYGIRPKQDGRTIIIGGITASNPRIFHGFFDYAVLGDGEVVINDLLEGIMNGSVPPMKGVVKDGDFGDNQFVHSKIIPASAYVEDRGNNTARIEIARGCRYKCPFCQLAYTKPYREQPLEVVAHILSKSETKSVGLFAPDRSGYSEIEKLESICKRLGKHNTAEDLRLDKVSKMKTVSKLKFGVEGFRAETRKRFKKVASNEKLVKGMKHIFTDLRKPNGKKHTTATMYMIGDLPGETPENSMEFWDVLREADTYCQPPFTLFLTLNSFSPKPFTPMECEGIHPYNDWQTFWNDRERFKNITIAGRGGMLGPSNRITHLLTARGDERATKLLFYLATSGSKVFKDRSKKAGKHLEKLIKQTGIDPEFIYSVVSDPKELPTSCYSI